jgi:hypothetical protein
MYILFNQLPLHVCALWKKNKYSFFLSFFPFACPCPVYSYYYQPLPLLL